MPLDTGPLLRILEYEEKTGYQDKTVSGGLDRFLVRWGEKICDITGQAQVLGQLKTLHLEKSGYAALTADERKQWIGKIREILTNAATGDNKDIPAVKIKPVKTPRIKTASSRIIQKKEQIPENFLNQPISALSGISTKISGYFAKLGVNTIRDLLYFFPYRHLNYSELKTIATLTAGAEETIYAIIWEAKVIEIRGRRSTEAIVGDTSGNLRVIWFNNPFIARKLIPNTNIVLSGKVSLFNGRLQFQNPLWEIPEAEELTQAGRLVPVYHLTEGLYPRQIRRLLSRVIAEWTPHLIDFLPDTIKRRVDLMDLAEAITQAHFPDNAQRFNAARQRLAFDELFTLQIGMMNRKRLYQTGEPAVAVKVSDELIKRFTDSLPFKLTGAQMRVLREILADLNRNIPMSRLLQGDVGSGKTVVATAALLGVVAGGHQGVLMAPTELLALQHFKTVSQLLQRFENEFDTPDLRGKSDTGMHPVKLALLIGDETPAKKNAIQEAVARGDIDIVIGTHTLIQRDVAFNDLVLAVIDEQHRFGVTQRAALRRKGTSPHILVMTATPIPRTLSLTLYGDLDLSVIDEMPLGRPSIKTKWLTPAQRTAAYRFISKEVAAGHQAYIICPLVEESESIEAKAATVEFERLSRVVFPGLNLGLLHGRMTAKEKDEVMHKFYNGNLDILVSTPVVEVGIDVPNATVMLVESAGRFGLSQLHQFRGRVGRGDLQSYCMLVSDSTTETGEERLRIIEKTQSGFVLAEEDLKIRGPGEFFGTRQSGLPDLRMAKISDVAILEIARNEAERLFDDDPELRQPENARLLNEVKRIWPRSDEFRN